MDPRFCCATDIGRRRLVNQDTVLADAALRLFVVADGMGGHEQGDIASRLIVERVREFVEATEVDKEKTWPFGFDLQLSYRANRLRASILQANRLLGDYAREHDPRLRMGATLAAALLGQRRAVFANVGDCRAYLLQQGHLRQLTRDHSWVADQVASGFITADTARAHPWRHMVTRAIQGDPDLLVDVVEIDLQAHTRLLLCSDGLHAVVPDALIADMLGQDTELSHVCATLVQAANDRGGPDNVSAIVIDFAANGQPEN